MSNTSSVQEEKNIEEIEEINLKNEILKEIEIKIDKFEKDFPTIKSLFNDINEVIDKSKKLNKNESNETEIIGFIETKVSKIIKTKFTNNENDLKSHLEILKQKLEKNKSEEDINNDSITPSTSTDEHQQKQTKIEEDQNLNELKKKIDNLIVDTFETTEVYKILDFFKEIGNILINYEEKISTKQIIDVIADTEKRISESNLIENEKNTVREQIDIPKKKLDKTNINLFKSIFNYLDPLIVWAEMKVGEEFINEKSIIREETPNDESIIREETPNDKSLKHDVILYFIMKFTRDFGCHMRCIFNEHLLLRLYSNIQNLYKAFGVDLSLRVKWDKIYDSDDYKQIRNENQKFYFYSHENIKRYEDLNVENLDHIEVNIINNHIKKIIDEENNYSLRGRMCLLFGYNLHYLVGTRNSDNWKPNTTKFSNHDLDELTKNNEIKPKQNSSK